MVTNRKFTVAAGTLALPTEVTTSTLEDVVIPDVSEDLSKYVAMVTRSQLDCFSCWSLIG